MQTVSVFFGCSDPNKWCVVKYDNIGSIGIWTRDLSLIISFCSVESSIPGCLGCLRGCNILGKGGYPDSSKMLVMILTV